MSYMSNLDLEYQEYVARCERLRIPAVTADEYLKHFAAKPPSLKPHDHYRRDDDQPTYPSLNSGEYNCFVIPKQRYSGDEVMGITLLHKQNYTPVTRNDPTNNDPKRGK